MYPNKVKVGQSHPVLASMIAEESRENADCLYTSTYTLQSNRAVFNKHAVDPTCKLCRSAPETSQHFLVECQALNDERRKYLGEYCVVTDRHNVDLSCPVTVKRLILDPSVFTDSLPDIVKLELISIDLYILPCALANIHCRSRCRASGI